jgi:hypothetical protein
MNMARLSTLGFLLLSVAGCIGGVDTPSEESDADTDTDSDTDTDTDTDTDSDTDADADFTGSVDFLLKRGTDTVCDSGIDLVGTTFAGSCEGCEFAFEIATTITRDHNDAECDLPTALTFVTSEGSGHAYLAFADSYTGRDFIGESATFNGALLAGYDGDQTTLGWTVTADSKGLTYGTFTNDGGDLTWSYYLSWAYGSGDLYGYDDSCGTPPKSAADAPFTGTQTANDTLDCAGLQADVWTFDTPAVDTEVEVTVDTTSADTAFDPAFRIDAPDGCTLVVADDNFACTYAPTAFSCPAAGIFSEKGTHSIVVRSQGSCTGKSSDYTIRVNGASSLTLAQDDVDAWEDVGVITITVDGEGHIAGK